MNIINTNTHTNTSWIKELKLQSVFQHRQTPGRLPLYYANQVASINLFDLHGNIELPQEQRRLELQPRTLVLYPPNTQRRFSIYRTGFHGGLHLSCQQWPWSEVQTFSCSSSQWQEFMAMFKRLHNYHDDQKMRARSWFESFMFDIMELTSQSKSNDHDQILNLMREMKENLNADFRVQTLAEQFQWSPQYFIAKFKHVAGNSPHAYLSQLRLKAAHHWLTQTDMAIKDIAHEVGYGNLQQFNKVIRKTFGDSPRTLRDNQGGIHSATDRH